MIKIRKFLKADIPYRVKWLNDPDVNKYTRDELGEIVTLKESKEWYEKWKNSNKRKYFTICDDTKPIGYMGLYNIYKINKNAELFIAIGDGDYRGKGVGKFSMEWIIKYAFEELNLHKISINVYEDNKKAIKLYKSFGAVVEGKIVDDVYYNGEYHNCLYMGLFNKKDKK